MGTAYYPGGQPSYRGEFAAGLFQGQGTAYNRQGGKVYTGSFSQGLYDGPGRLYLSRGQWIEASFTEGAPEGTVQWIKNGALYYEGAWSGGAEGFGRIYSRAGKILYEGQFTGGTVDGPWLLDLSLDEFRAALGQGALRQEVDPSGGFTITSPALGLSARCRFRQDDAAAVDMVTLFRPEQDGADWVELLPKHLTGSGIRSGETAFAGIQGVPVSGGVYPARQAVREEGYRQLLLLNAEQAPILYQWAKTGAGDVPALPEEAEEDPGGSRMDALLAALDMMEGAGAAAADSGAAASPYFGSGEPSGALAACAGGPAGAALVDAMLLYWEYAERRTAAEANLARARQLLEETGALGGNTAPMEAECAALEGVIEACAGGMSKAALTAQEAAGVDLAQYNAADAAVMFDPAQMDVEDLALMTAAYIQSTGGAVDAGGLALELKTALVDLTTAYNSVQRALQGYEDAGTAAREAAMAYSMETGSKQAWFAALSAKEDARAALVGAIAGFSRQANNLNGKSGGWVSRNCGWYVQEFTALFQRDVEDQARPPKPLEDRLEEILQGVQGTEEGT